MAFTTNSLIQLCDTDPCLYCKPLNSSFGTRKGKDRKGKDVNVQFKADLISLVYCQIEKIKREKKQKPMSN